jgi:hypothetical protein
MEPRHRIDPDGFRVTHYEEKPPGASDLVPESTEQLSKIAAAGTNPFALLHQALLALKNIEATANLQLDLERKVEEHLRAGLPGRPTWRSLAFRYTAASDKVRELEFSNSSNIGNLYVSTVPTGAAGRFYMSLHKRIELLADGVTPHAGSWDYVGALGGESLKFPVPKGMPKLFIYSPVDFEGTLYVAEHKDFLPS